MSIEKKDEAPKTYTWWEYDGKFIQAKVDTRFLTWEHWQRQMWHTQVSDIVSFREYVTSVCNGSYTIQVMLKGRTDTLELFGLFQTLEASNAAVAELREIVKNHK